MYGIVYGSLLPKDEKKKKPYAGFIGIHINFAVKIGGDTFLECAPLDAESYPLIKFGWRLKRIRFF